MKVFYLGPEGTNSNLAAQEIFTSEFDYVPLPSIEDIFQKVALSHSYYGVIPFENSYQGVINSSLNCLIDYDLKIVKELKRHLRRRHGEGQPPRRRERLGLPRRQL